MLTVLTFFLQVFFAFNGQNGHILWEFEEDHKVNSDLMSVYAAQFVHDLDGDGVQEILAVHGGHELADPGKWKNTMFSVIIDPRGRPSVAIIVFAHVVRPSVPTFQNKANFKQK